MNGETHKLRKSVLEVTLYYGKPHLGHTFINGEKEAKCLKTQKMQSFQLASRDVGYFCTISACLVGDESYI